MPPEHVINIKEPICRLSECSTIARMEGGNNSSPVMKRKELRNLHHGF